MSEMYTFERYRAYQRLLDEETVRMTQLEGLFPCPESATIVAGLRTAMERGVVDADDRTVLVVTGSGIK